MQISNRQFYMLNCLYYKGKMTARELALQANVSERTVKTEMALLKSTLKKGPMQLCAKPGEGYWLCVTEPDRAAEFFGDSRQYYQMTELVNNVYERSSYIIKRLLMAEGYVKVEELSAEMYVSHSTVNSTLRQVRGLLQKFMLTLQTRPNYGLFLSGREFDKRLCISDYFFHNTISSMYSELGQKTNLFNEDPTQLELIEGLLRKSCERQKIYLSDFSYKNIATHVLVAMVRNQAGLTLEPEEQERCLGIGSAAKNAATELTRELTQQVNRPFPPQEILYTALHIDSKQIRLAPSPGKQKVDEVLQLILAEIKSNFDVDFTGDTQLYQYLCLHIPQMILRIRRGLSIRNPMVYENLRSYLFGVKITISAVAIIEQSYGVQVELDEFGYLLIYFQTALATQRQNRTVSIGFVSGRGRSEALIYRQEFTQYFRPPYYKLRFYDSLQQALKEKHPLDILVSIYPVEVAHVPYNISIESGGYLERIEKSAQRLREQEVNLNHYFKPEYFCAPLKGNTKDEVMQEIVAYFKSIGVIYKEQTPVSPFVCHQMGNGAIHLQDLKKIVHKPICFVGVLEKPVLWNQAVARFVFLIKTKKEGDSDLYHLCDIFSRFISDTEKVNTLLESRDFISFFSMIQCEE